MNEGRGLRDPFYCIIVVDDSCSACDQKERTFESMERGMRSTYPPRRRVHILPIFFVIFRLLFGS